MEFPQSQQWYFLDSRTIAKYAVVSVIYGDKDTIHHFLYAHPPPWSQKLHSI
jgi:hypothetical protein